MERERGKEMYPGQSRNCFLSLSFCRQISFLREQNNLGKSSHWAQFSFACLQMDPQRIFLSALMVLVFITQGRDFQDYLNEKFCREGEGELGLSIWINLIFFHFILPLFDFRSRQFANTGLLQYCCQIVIHQPLWAEVQTPFILVNILCETAFRLQLGKKSSHEFSNFHN